MIDHTHDPAASSWVTGADADPDFPVQNLPLGVFAPRDGAPRIGSRIGDFAVDLAALAPLLPAECRAALAQPVLNDLFALGPEARRALRHALFALLTDPAQRGAVEPHLHATYAELLQCRVGDYTDFYVGIHHATAIGKLFRPDNPLLPNYKHVPIGYHGRASSVRASGAVVRRPSGQRKAPDADMPSFGPCQRLDYELELGLWIGGENALGEPTPIAAAGERIAGISLLNDWSARDLQAWEYQPLGPFLAKNFLTSVSPWVVTAEALAPFRCAQPSRPAGDPQPLPYLWDAADQARGGLRIGLEVWLETAAMRAAGLLAQRLSAGTAGEAMYWTMAQLVAHHTASGCDLQPGDLLGTGTLSGPTPDSAGSLMELSAGGKVAVALPGGESRTFLQHGDCLTMLARAEAPGYRAIGFGACTGTVEG